MPSLHLPGVHLWYTDTGGSGTPVILLHAASGTCESWVYQLPAFTSAGYRCIAYDRRGWGRSQPDPAGEQPGYVGDDLHGLVVHLGLERCHLVATAAGGIAALDYATTHPARVGKLVVSCSIGGVQDPAYLAVQHRLRPQEIQGLPIELRELGPSYRGTEPDGTRHWMDIAYSCRPDGTHGPGQPLRQPMTYARLATLRVPVLMLAGEADLLSPPALMRLLAAPIPQCQLVKVSEAGHAAFWEQPEVWNRLVLDFLS
ncbi:MAG: alpha/beta hydrolase [Candidatus Tectomicrobia bacterium]|uniref:Alpha/beta hydrolase n=1 Tax=Tectimicrobiota bacterium TaxID=2528274 RepID=A0A937VWL3_UNCTE|nr:alpha/beta hydrolase [Candidatus Tectomicrobia bacterium]